MINAEETVITDGEVHRWNRRASDEARLAIGSATHHLLAISARLQRTRDDADVHDHVDSLNLLYKLIDEATEMENELSADVRRIDAATDMK